MALTCHAYALLLRLGMLEEHVVDEFHQTAKKGKKKMLSQTAGRVSVRSIAKDQKRPLLRRRQCVEECCGGWGGGDEHVSVWLC